MCGIIGMISSNPLPQGWHEDLEKMSDLLVHRGPDDFGFFGEGCLQEKPSHHLKPHANSRVAFAHRRLSILDLSESARQPMVRSSGKIFLTYNGEIYNFQSLRNELKNLGASFQTVSDTEVLIEAYCAWGIDCVFKLRGIFAFALADLNQNKVFLVRDHLGVKPIYILHQKDIFYFTSEIKAFLALKNFQPEADFDALKQYLQFLWIPGTQTGFQKVRKLEAGTILTIDLNSGQEKQQTYWSPFTTINSPNGYSDFTEEEALKSLRLELTRAVEEELVSDVPLGAFLSGGLDSSLVCSLMKKTYKTFSVGYNKKDLAYDIVPDDIPFAKEVSTSLKIPHQEIVLSPNVSELLPKVIWHLDEPLGDPAALSSYLICEAAKKNGLTVMLSGVGGDELFAGYPRQKALLYANYFKKLPQWVRHFVRCFSEQLPGAGKTRAAKMGRALKKFLNGIEEDSLSHYIGMESYFPPRLQKTLCSPHGPFCNGNNLRFSDHQKITNQIDKQRLSPLKQALLLDLLTYLPCLNLAYTDKTSMAHSVEVRVPLLDIRLVQFALARKEKELLKWNRGKLEGKWLLKKAAEPFLPSSIIWRKKAGFGAPIRSWLRQDLKELRHELLGKNGLNKRGWFQPEAIQCLEKEFFSGEQDHALKLWTLMSLELWARQYLDRK